MKGTPRDTVRFRSGVCEPGKLGLVLAVREKPEAYDGSGAQSHDNRV